MVLTARILNLLSGDTALRVLVEIGFYDASDPLNDPLPVIFIDKRTYPGESLTDIPALLATLDVDGAAIRTQYERVLAIKAALPIGEEYIIPGT